MLGLGGVGGGGGRPKLGFGGLSVVLCAHLARPPVHQLEEAAEPDPGFALHSTVQYTVHCRE